MTTPTQRIDSLDSLVHFDHHILGSMPIGYVAQDATGVIVDFNAAATELLGVTPDQLLGRTSVDPRWRSIGADGHALPGQSHPAMVTLRTRQPVDDFTMGIRRPDGRLVWLSVSSRLVHPDSDTSHVFTTFVDVTERRALRNAHLVTQAADHVLLRSRSAHDLVSDMCRIIIDVGNHVLAWIGRAEHDAAGVTIVAAAGTTDYLYDGIVSVSSDEPRGRGPVGRAIRDGVPVVIPDIATSASFAPWRERAAEFDVASVIAIPFRSGTQRAALAIYSREPSAFSTENMALFAHLGQNLEFGIDNLERVRQLRRSLDATVRTISNIAEIRDAYTAGHQRRVAEIAVGIGRDLGLDGERIEHLRLGALVHDIGKIAVPAEILTKPSGLNNAEWELIRAHALTGETLLRDGAIPSPVPEIAGQHHERLDGSGYPRGLRGDDICLEAQIVAVADVVEAIMHHRPYRPARGVAAALDTIRAGAGTLFNPAIVDACTRVPLPTVTGPEQR